MTISQPPREYSEICEWKTECRFIVKRKLYSDVPWYATNPRGDKIVKDRQIQPMARHEIGRAHV